MNDRFKFRVWDKDQKIMKECTQITLNQEQKGSMCDVKGKVTAHLIYQPHYILMQSTGLKDKNGKLIYEGDIVKRYFICRSSIGDIVEENLFTVEFENFKFGLCQIAILKGCTDYSPFLNFDEALELEEYAEEMEEITLEIIGNIYENPELLKEYEDD